MPLDERPWNIGLIVGPSGCGKSTIAAKALAALARSRSTWPTDRCLLDGFPADAVDQGDHGLALFGRLRVAAGMVASVSRAKYGPAIPREHGSAPGRAQTIREVPIVVDEFTSVVDRTVAQIGSAALARTVRKKGLRFVAVTCHEDVEDWLQPDWVYRPAEQTFAWRLLRRRPDIALDVVRCQASAWPLFAPHHYLSAPWPHRRRAFSRRGGGPGRVLGVAAVRRRGTDPPREHRTVTLPDYQGVGIGNALSALIASMWKALGYRALSTTTHPAMIAARYASSLWRMHRRPSFAGGGDKLKHATTRLTAGFEYIGPAMKVLEAKALRGW